MAKIMNNQELKTVAPMPMDKIIVHAGCFHADDAMCVAIARMINPSVMVERVFKAPDTVDDGTVIADIGEGKYDHHQADGRVREDTGEKYAACGLLLEDYWPLIFPTEDDYRKFDQSIIRPIELADNGVCPNPLTVAVNSFTPDWDSDESMDSAFFKAVDMLQGILEREVESANARLRAQEIVQTALDKSDGNVVILPQFAPWQGVLIPSTALFVVFPSNRGGYNLQVVPAEEGSFTAKQDLPAEWLDEKPEGCTFVHAGRFLASFQTEEQAVAAAESLI